MKEIICEAVRNKQRIKFEYNGKPRMGEPQCCGQTTTGKDAVRVHLTYGGSRPEQLFELGKIKSLEVLNEYFINAGPNYHKNDSAMQRIYCQL